MPITAVKRKDRSGRPRVMNARTNFAMDDGQDLSVWPVSVSNGFMCH